MSNRHFAGFAGTLCPSRVSSNEVQMRVCRGGGYPQTPQNTILRHPFDGCSVAVTEVVTAWSVTAGSVIPLNQRDSEAFESHPLRQDRRSLVNQ